MLGDSEGWYSWILVANDDEEGAFDLVYKDDVEIPLKMPSQVVRHKHLVSYDVSHHDVHQRFFGSVQNIVQRAGQMEHEAYGVEEAGFGD